jgi:curved DNA-binding protein
MEYKDYYKTLGVDKNASQDEIKKAYRELARKLHPDVSKADDAEARFKEINEAYEALGDPDKRQKYDQFGSQWQQYERMGGAPGGFDWSQWRSQPGGGQYTYHRTVNPEEFEEMFGGGGSGGFSSFFETLFGGGQTSARNQSGFGFDPSGMGGEAYATRALQGRDIDYPIEVSLQEAFHGATRSIQWEDGRRVEVRIPRGVYTGAKVRLAGKGEAGSGGGAAGDMYLHVIVLPDSTYDRNGDNLRLTVPVDLYTMLLGGKVSVSSLDKTVQLTIPEGTQPGKTFRLRGLGMPNMRDADQRGDLLATAQVTLPEHLTDEEKRRFEELRDLRERETS